MEMDFVSTAFIYWFGMFRYNELAIKFKALKLNLTIKHIVFDETIKYFNST